MLSAAAQGILGQLGRVEAERQRLATHPALAERVAAIKRWQSRRFENTYADLLADPATQAAARFFLDDLYGAQDFSARDHQFGRIVPALDRLFPNEIVRTVLDLAELHALSETMDRRMGEALAHDGPAAAPGDDAPGEPRLDAARYARAWCHVGEPQTRERQIGLMLTVGRALVGYTRNRLLRHSLRLMRGPARLAGLLALHQFLERGFDTFAGLKDPNAFLDTVAARERRLAAELFADS
jgi:hypothetical protein